MKPIAARDAGTVSTIDTRAVGLAVVALGGGRSRAADAIDHSVGLTDLVGIGEEVGPNRPLGVVHARDEASADAAAATVRSAYRLGDPPKARLIYEHIGGEAR
jgi:thymidine phosphorylase